MSGIGVNNIEGNLVDDVKYHQNSKTGATFASMRLAVRNRRRNEQGNWEELEPDFVDVTVSAPRIIESLQASPTIGKGTYIGVSGSISASAYIGKEDSQAHASLKISAYQVYVPTSFNALTVVKQANQTQQGFAQVSPATPAQAPAQQGFFQPQAPQAPAQQGFFQPQAPQAQAPVAPAMASQTPQNPAQQGFFQPQAPQAPQPTAPAAVPQAAPQAPQAPSVPDGQFF